jgi:hypothetical protein
MNIENDYVTLKIEKDMSYVEAFSLGHDGYHWDWLTEENKKEWKKRWKAFIDCAKENDEVVYFKSSSLTWLRMSGRAGFSIIRDKQAVYSIITLMS